MGKTILAISIIAAMTLLSACYSAKPMPGPPLRPEGDKVFFYGDMKYTGASRAFNMGAFVAAGSFKDNISSIYIPPGMFVRVNDARGRSETFTISQSNLQQNVWDNNIVSGVIGRN